MIELNCSYEESKQILELGYDFSKVCWKTGYYWDEAYLEHTHGTGLLIETQAYRISYLNDHKGNTRDHTPIIPKAALEACLPMELPILNENIDESWKLYLLKNLYGAETISYQKILSLPADEIYKIHRADWDKLIVSAFEAFIWCHEHYPEELKKKFSEVMG